MIKLLNVDSHYGATQVLKNITLTINEPGIYCLLGRNGAGKTTLLKAIAGRQNIFQGSIIVANQAITVASMNTWVSYIENFAQHFNLPIGKLINIAGQLNPHFDYEFALEMMTRFHLDNRKKFKHLSLGMKTMISTIICLASNQKVVLLDEPVLGFDAIMRMEFYEMLSQSYQKKPRVIIVSTHIIEEITKTIHKLIIIDQGTIKFFDNLTTIEEKAYKISGLKRDVNATTSNLKIINQKEVGGLMTTYIFDTPPKDKNLVIEKLSLQEFFIQMVANHKGDK